MAYPLPGFGPADRQSHFRLDDVERLASPSRSTSNAGIPLSPLDKGRGGTIRKRCDHLNEYGSSAKDANLYMYCDKGVYMQLSNRQTALEVAQSNAAEIVTDPRLWRQFKATIRRHRIGDGGAIPTTNLFALEYLHRFVEHEFELEAEAEEEALYQELMQRQSLDKTGANQDKSASASALQKAANWLSDSLTISFNDTVGLQKENERHSSMILAYDQHKDFNISPSSRRTTMSTALSSSFQDSFHSSLNSTILGRHSLSFVDEEGQSPIGPLQSSRASLPNADSTSGIGRPPLPGPPPVWIPMDNTSSRSLTSQRGRPSLGDILEYGDQEYEYHDGPMKQSPAAA